MSQPLLNLLHRHAVHDHQTGTAMAQIVEADVRQTILPEQPFKVFRHEVGTEQFAFLIGADEVQIIGAVALAEQSAVCSKPSMPNVSCFLIQFRNVCWLTPNRFTSAP